MGRGHGSVSEMLTTLEDRRSFGHAKARKGAIWTREFLASGKIGKL